MKITIALIFILVIGCGTNQQSKKKNKEAVKAIVTNTTKQIIILPPMDWVNNPYKEWPQILLTNEAHFKGHTSLKGASAFLIKNNHGVLLGATAKHLLGEAGGVEPEVQLAKFDEELLEWNLFPRTKEDKKISLGGIAFKGLDSEDLDWLILKVKQTKDLELPAVPLFIRKEPVKVGEEVYLVGVPYAEVDHSQNIYKGKVIARANEDRFKFTISPPVDIRGFSGAPILDTKGNVVGVMTLWFEPKMVKNKFLEAGGEDIIVIYEEIEAIRQ